MTTPIRLFARWTCAALVALALPAWADVSRDDAVAVAVAVAQSMGGGRVLSVERSEAGRRPVWRVKLVTARGEVRVMHIDAVSGQVI
jgi:hypothetical protein